MSFNRISAVDSFNDLDSVASISNVDGEKGVVTQEQNYERKVEPKKFFTKEKLKTIGTIALYIVAGIGCVIAGAAVLSPIALLAAGIVIGSDALFIPGLILTILGISLLFCCGGC